MSVTTYYRYTCDSCGSSVESPYGWYAFADGTHCCMADLCLDKRIKAFLNRVMISSGMQQIGIQRLGGAP